MALCAKIGEVLEIPFKRPRIRAEITEDPKYYELRNYALDFLFHRYAHSEDPVEEEVETKGNWKLKVTAIVGVVALAIAGFAFVQNAMKNPQTNNNTIELQGQ
jgi:nitrate/nitrite transport system ATP-binding protein